MPKICEDIILIIFHYLHHNKMKILNQEYLSKYVYNVNRLLCWFSKNRKVHHYINWRNPLYIADDECIRHTDKYGVSELLDIPLPKNY